LDYWAALDRVYASFGEAARRVEAATGQPICVPDCGMCCKDNTIHCYGVEAEYIASFLLGTPARLKLALDACRDWLTRPRKSGQWTYGRKVTPELWQQLVDKGELMAALTEPCPFLLDDKKCLIHDCRPAVCRAYGVTRLPGKDCPRPVGINESSDARCWWDPHHPSLPVFDMMQACLAKVKEQRYQRQGFLPAMLFERFYAKELAGMLDDGRVPLVKLGVGVGQGYMLLWQEEMEATWSAILADRSIETQVPLREENGLPRMVLQ